MFTPGQLVVCVDASFSVTPKARFGVEAFSTDLHGLQKGAVYTIRAVGVDDGSELWEPILSVWLEESVRPAQTGSNVEVPYRAGRFRPVSPKAVEAVREMLAAVLARELVE